MWVVAVSSRILAVAEGMRAVMAFGQQILGEFGLGPYACERDGF